MEAGGNDLPGAHGHAKTTGEKKGGRGGGSLLAHGTGEPEGMRIGSVAGIDFCDFRLLSGPSVSVWGSFCPIAQLSGVSK